MTVTSRNYVIYAYDFDPNGGGVIALYALCQRLNDLGHSAAIWPFTKPRHPLPRSPAEAMLLVRYLKHRLNFNKGVKKFGCTIATWRDLKRGIVVYPEVVGGNPTGAKAVVRWYLHKPGFHGGEIDFGPADQHFFYQDAFNDPSINDEPENRLTVTWFNPVYTRTNFGQRSGTCYLLRKGIDRAPDPTTLDGPIVDSFSHVEMAAAFNRYKYLVSYDTYTMYSVFAAVCGCIPVIVPEPGLPRDAWFPSPSDRLGLAYGWSDVEHAVATRDGLLRKLSDSGDEENQMVATFVKKTQSKFFTSKHRQQ